ncbi:MAG: hypothetical protein AAF571_07155 [Verrucomicrobiota bacterium]
MNILSAQVFQTFPEVQDQIFPGDEDLSYVLLGSVVDWLESLDAPDKQPETVNRVVQFAKWCTKQPRGESSEDDILTVFSVSFLEKVMESPKLRFLVPKIIDQSSLKDSREYFLSWVGEENYKKCLSGY